MGFDLIALGLLSRRSNDQVKLPTPTLAILPTNINSRSRLEREREPFRRRRRGQVVDRVLGWVGLCVCVF